MKLTKISASLAFVASLAMVSCGEGQYWDEADMSSVGQVYAFAKPAETLSVPADGTIPSSYTVTVSRSSDTGAVTVPVKFTSKSNILSGPATVDFAAGSLTADYVINIASGAKAGVTYSCTIALEPNNESILHADKNNLSFTFNLSQVLVLKWENKGTAATLSSWANNAAPINIPVQEAVNWPNEGQRLMRLVSPYYYLEPSVAQEGANIQFLLKPNGDALSMYQNWTYMGESDADYGYFFFGCPANYGGYFMNQGDIFVMNGIVAYGASMTGNVTPGWYETIQFKWSDYGK